MNSKMTTNSQLATTKPKKNKNKNKLSKRLEQELNHRYGDHMEGYQWGEGGGRMGKKVQEISISRQGEVKNSIGIGEPKELIGMTHGRELRGGECCWQRQDGEG